MAKMNIQEYTRALAAELKSYVKQYNTLEYAAEHNGIEELPVGHIIPYMGLTAPRHYLVCDGAEYAAAEYPELFEHLSLFPAETRAQWGNADWSTSFNVPKLQGEFLRGSGTNGYDNQGAGAAVGVHQNATETPNIIAGTDNTFNIPRDSTSAHNNPSYMDTVKPNAKVYNLGSTKLTDATWQTYERYTSRPTNTAVLFCIRYEPSYNIKVEGKEIYSTEERVIGTWIDGKPIYRKTFDVEYAPTTAAGVLSTKDIPLADIGINDFESAVALCGMFHNGNRPIPSISYLATNNTECLTAFVSNNQLFLRNSLNPATTPQWTATMTMDYTKTTD